MKDNEACSVGSHLSPEVNETTNNRPYGYSHDHNCGCDHGDFNKHYTYHQVIS